MGIKKIKTNLYKIILAILFVLVAYVTYRSVFSIYNPSQEMKPIVIIIGTIVMLFLFISLKKLLNKFNKKQINIISIIMCIAFFIGLSVFGNTLTSIPRYDLSHIIREANIMLQNGGKFATQYYYGKYPSQAPLTILVFSIYKIGTLIGIQVGNLKSLAIVVNSLFMAIAVYFVYLSVKKLKNEKAGLLTILFLIINPIFYLYSSYFYTDTICMPYAMIAIYLYINAIQNKNGKKKLLLYILSGVILALGFEIRVVLAIFLIAMIIELFLNNEKIKNTITHICPIIIGFIIGIIIYNIIAMPFGVIKKKCLEFPITHWIKMSLNEESDGRYNLIDHNSTYRTKGYQAKVKENIETISTRLEKMGLTGWLTLSKEKLAVNWSNGDYNYKNNFDNIEKINKLYNYFVGNKRLFLIYYLQICKTVLMFALLMAIGKEFTNKSKTKYKFIYISIFGAFLFYLIWEVLSRYSLTFLPIIALVFVEGIESFEKIINIEKIEIELKNKMKIVNLEKILKGGILTVMSLTIILGLINFPKYTIKKSVYQDKIVQAKGRTESVKIADSIIEQTFTTDKTFDNISVKLKKKSKETETNYYFILENSEGQELVKKEFSSNDVKNNISTKFSFDTIKPDKIEKYKIKIYSENATEDNTLRVVENIEDFYDLYPGGTLSCNGEELDGDLNFEVRNKTKRTYMSKRLYIAIMVLIIGVEIYAFYPYIKNRKE